MVASPSLSIKFGVRTAHSRVSAHSGRRFIYIRMLDTQYWRQHWTLRSRSFGSRLLSVPGRCLLLLFSVQPALQPVEIDIDNRRRIKREKLRQSEAADDGIPERLANLRADPGTHHHRHAAKQCGHRGHQDRPEAQDAGLIDRFFRRQAVAVLDLLGKIDQHDSVLLDDTDEQYEADNRDYAQIDVNRHQ